ncbi:MAG: glycoside hydrolase family 31 protein, partial [bacterium]|nr:glycoside hydrolase family 31 protein [bacterium]MDY4098449.1 glycoside hydrolase family 31 protein [Lachnospiraceae bacterium]
WIQMGCFLPIFRSHGTDTPREIWNFGSKGTIFYDAIEKYIKLRYRLMPYIYSLAGDVVHNNGTIMRSLLFDFPSDRKAVRLATQFMFGKSLLVCPVLKPMYYEAESKELQTDKTWKVYLPEGTDWYDFETGERYAGGQEVQADAPIDRMPLYVRAGSVIPMTEGLQHAMEKNGEPVRIHVYPGADGVFTLYDDAGNDYSYEDGAYAQILLSYDDASGELTIGAREGSYPGMDEQLCYEIYVVNEKKAEGVYSGEEQRISL